MGKRREHAQRNEARGAIPVPSAADWGRIPADDLDMAAAHAAYYGLSCAQLAPKFIRQPISMVDGLRWMPVKPLGYYLRCLAEFLVSDHVPESGAPDLASAFLRLVEEKAATSPLAIRACRESVRSAVEHLAAHQARFDANPDIYGDFAVKAVRIRELLDAL